MKYALPAWLLEAVGEPRPVNFIWSDSKNFVVSYNGRPNRFYPTMDAAYSSVGGEAVRIDSALKSTYGAYSGARRDGNASLIMSRTDEDVLAKLEETMFSFIRHASTEYFANPTDFMACYDFIAQHPALWLRANPSAPATDQNWEVNGGVSAIKLFPQRKGDGDFNFVINLFERVAPEYTVTEFNEQLSGQTASYEEGIIEAAATLQNFFHPTGERRDRLSEQEAVEQFTRMSLQHKKNTSVTGGRDTFTA